MKPIPEGIAKGSKVIFDHCNKECDEKRKFMIPIWKRAEYYWNDIQDLFFNAVNNDWSTFNEAEGDDEFDAITDSNKIINNYRAEGESIIAAATVGNLSIRFFPENADDPIDLDKARSFSDKSDYVQRVNDIKDLRRKAFTIRWNQGLAASYTYFKKDKKQFGTITKDVIGVKQVIYNDKTCVACGAEVPSPPITEPEELAMPDDAVCPECGGIEFEENSRTEEIPYKIGEEKRDRGCAVIEIYSPLHFKIPHYATKTSDINYVILETEMHYAVAKALYPDYADKIQENMVETTEAINRTQADNYSAIPSRSLVTVSRFWCKPELYNVLGDDVEKDGSASAMLKAYPDGKFATFIDNELVECKNEDMDEHWSFVKSPLDTHVYIRALGNSRIPIQDMENDLVFLTMDTIKHAIGETFYDSRVIDRRTYSERMSKPGDMTPVVNIRGAADISSYFYSTKSASLSQEVDSFLRYLETKGQFVSGAMPSIFGGMFEAGSKTLGVYEQSRQQALQRVAMPANGIDDFLAATIYKATEIYDKNMEGDEITSYEQGTSYVNKVLRKSAPGARIARVEAVKSEQFPTTWEQKRAFAMEMLEKQLEPVTAMIFSVDNIEFMSRIVGIPELKVPGAADHNKQLHEIQDLLKSEPQMDPNVMVDPNVDPAMQPQAPFIPTIMPEAEVDNHDVHIQTIISWAVSPEGMREKINNPGGYANVLLHLAQHKMLVPPPTAAPVDGEKTEEQP